MAHETAAAPGALKAFPFAGPAGKLEGLWKDAAPPARGAAVFAHPHPRHGGTLHNKVVFRVARELTAAGWGTLRFNFRGVGVSEGVYDEGRGETQDFRAALDEAQRRAGTPIVAGGFSFGSAAALRAIVGDGRIAAYLAIGLPVATESVADISRPAVPSLFVVGELDSFGPPDRLREFVADSGEIVVVPGADHFFAGRLDALGEAVAAFLSRVAAEIPVR